MIPRRERAGLGAKNEPRPKQSIRDAAASGRDKGDRVSTSCEVKSLS